MPEILFLLASIPALVTSGFYTFRKTPGTPRLPPENHNIPLEP